jgi:uncharacterized short protein YbdD (DUF466 family)
VANRYLALPARLYAIGRDIIRGAAGADAYAAYCAHAAAHHPDEPRLSREAFFRQEFSARWEGIRRCC